MNGATGLGIIYVIGSVSASVYGSSYAVDLGVCAMIFGCIGFFWDVWKQIKG